MRRIINLEVKYWRRYVGSDVEGVRELKEKHVEKVVSEPMGDGVLISLACVVTSLTRWGGRVEFRNMNMG